MKIYDTQRAPNPRRVRIFLAEKGIEMTYVPMNLQGGDNLSDDFVRKNPWSKVPLLELEDGTCIGETQAICRYFEVLKPEPALLGKSALEQAEIEMWQRRVELGFSTKVELCFQHGTDFFADRMTPVTPVAEWARLDVLTFLDKLEAEFDGKVYVAGEAFSMADITLFCSLEFARVVSIRLGDNHPNLKAWYERVKIRPSINA